MKLKGSKFEVKKSQKARHKNVISFADMVLGQRRKGMVSSSRSVV